MVAKPLIGITMRLETETGRFYLGRDYSEAVYAAGGIPIHIALLPDIEYVSEVVAGLDGILLPGSDTDPDPELYGEEPHVKLKKVVPEKDKTDLLALEVAEANRLPILAICFGMQILNVSRGGSLVQDIESQIDGVIKHEQGYPLERRSHSISIARESILAPAAFDESSDGIVRVNSHHHQSVSKLGRDLQIAAKARDGVIEAVEDTRSGRFVLGVQWHPELTWKSDSLSAMIFETFVMKCAAGRH
jgi:putative glutamine amidotransferase